MKIEIWSDVMCPFCYIGKRRFEEALHQSGYQDQIEVEWKSFQLNPDMKTNPDLNIVQYLADTKGWTVDYSQQMHDHLTQMAAEVGLTYHFDQAIVANSFNAHRFSHLAKKYGLGDKAEEALFKAYFTDGQNIDKQDTLIKLGVEIGLDAEEIKQVLDADTYADDVKHDIAEAQQLGIQGVPFFVLNNKYGISGAQAVPVFQETIEKSFTEWQQENTKPALTIIEGESCSPDGDCN
ncbi:MAG: DSBA-like thioredoxin domain protein [Mucilaginibacter sp.]|nr:DSBA-like thioredoxin domain protein [Mucilaginibacter sp.]